MTPTPCAICGEELDPLLPAYVCDRDARRLLDLLSRVLDVVTPPPLISYLDRRTNPPTRRTRRATDGGRVEPGLASSLEAAIRGELRFGSSGPSARPVDAPLPYNPEAATARDELIATLRRHADEIAAVRGLARPLDTLESLAPWLGTQVEWMTTRLDGPPRISALMVALVDAQRWLQRREDTQHYRGQCTAVLVDETDTTTVCGASLYVSPRAEVLTCRVCGALYPADHRRREMLEAAQDRTLTAADACIALRGLGVTLTPSTIRSWVHRDKVAPVGWTSTSPRRPLYRVGDLWERTQAEAARQAARRVRSVR
jgi:hypothetical protein